MIRTIIAAATAATLASAAQAGDFVQVIGLGFGETKSHARVAAVRAWVQEAKQSGASFDFNAAHRSDMVCFEQEPQASAYGTLAAPAIGISGDPDAAWACEISAFTQHTD